jgi:beta-lactamase superfamily II metal-dependent hydrolase
MKCEIEFLAVGEGEKAGDAIIVRYGEVNDYRLMLIDGGYTDTGEKLVEHLKYHFGANVVLQDVLLTHSDGDHASGLRIVMEEIPVNNLHLHIPWLHAEESRRLNLFADKRWTEDGLRQRLRDDFSIIAEIVELAEAVNCPMFYPFAGYRIGPFHILSPTREVYRYLLPQFPNTPDPDQAAIVAANMWIGKESLLEKLLQKATAAVQSWTTENWAYERLKDGGITSASNESSVVLYGSFEGGPVRPTGDAGINGLTWAANQADYLGLPLQQFRFVQVPHHGSRRNVGPTILNRLLGPKQLETDPTRFTAFVSAPKDDEKHPRRIVTNAFKRRGAKLVATQGTNVIHYGGFQARQNYGAVDILPFYSQVEEYT